MSHPTQRGPHGLNSSHLLAITEAALDHFRPKWRQEEPFKRQQAKDAAMTAIWEGLVKADIK